MVKGATKSMETEIFIVNPSHQSTVAAEHFPRTARMHPVAKRVFYRKRINELEAFQPKCQQMTFKLFCNHCDKFTDDADFDHCMTESSAFLGGCLSAGS